MERIRQAEVSRPVDTVSATATAAASPADAVVNLSQGLISLTNNIISTAVFGGECRQQQAYLRELEVVVTLAGGFNLPDLFPSSRLAWWLSGAVRDLRRSHARVESIIAGIVQEHKETRSTSPGVSADVEDEDLLDVLLRLQDGSLTFPLTTEIIGAVIADIFGAATETTATTLEWAMAELIKNPQAMSRATCEVRQKLGPGRVMITDADLGSQHYLRMVIKETLRLRPAAPFFINAFAVARDPRFWDNAEEFRPERFESSTLYYKWTYFEFIPFGAGRRQCPGALFATTTMEFTLRISCTTLIGSNPKGLDMAEMFGITVRRRSNLCMLATLHLGH
ncbi:Germacrene A oxidase [Dichanthelium oligosanthes]|uniref:Germacrene A oxidase n=1 Tax=Dichanthelium oligosanthes TaxID=888268 RepID=A0A1E5VRE3_9POAL|nr:Germacrene A oxidase [Dichanthelium oligosanthes]